MDEPVTIYEGTWEEVRAHDAELTGKNVRLVVQTVSPAHENQEVERRVAARQFSQAHEAASRLEAKMLASPRRDSVAMVRKARAGGMFDYRSDE